MTRVSEPDLKKIDELIRVGKMKDARREIVPFRDVKLTRPFALGLSRAARRAGLPDIAIRMLNPIVRPGAKSSLVANDEERAVYAAALIRIGAVTEAKEILRDLDSVRVPESLLYQTFALVSEWNYAATVPLLKRYIKTPRLDGFQRLIGELNLAAAYVHEKEGRSAETLLAKLRDQTKEEKLLQLYGNSLELSAQQAIFERRWKDAEEYLKEAQFTLKEVEGLDAFFVKKWRAIMDILRDPKKRAPLNAVRVEASHLKHWETIRDCDRFECIATQNENLYLHLFFGTPYGEFRTRLQQDYPTEIDLPSTYNWSLGPASISKSSKIVLEVKRGQILDRLLRVLSSDFYRPLRLASIYAGLYPGEYFNPRSSPDKVHQTMKRLRIEIKAQRVPLLITESEGSYALRAKEPGFLEIENMGLKPDRRSTLLEALHKTFGDRAFSVGEAAVHLKCSERSTVRLLLEGTHHGLLIREGKASKTRYHF